MLTLNFAQVASIAPWSIFAPLDLARVRLQMQGELQKSGSYEKQGLIGIMKNIFHQEGMRGLYRGFIPIAALTQINAVRLYTYDILKQTQIPRIVSSSLMGYFCGMIASPIQMAKSRIMCGVNQRGLLWNLRNIYATNQQLQQNNQINFRLFKGAQLAGLRSGGASLLQLPTFDLILRLSQTLPEATKICLASSISTILMITIGQPLEVLVTRIYNEQAHTYKGFLKGVNLIMHHEGFLGLYKGYVASMITFGPVVFMQMSLYQLLKDEFSQQ